MVILLSAVRGTGKTLMAQKVTGKISYPFSLYSSFKNGIVQRK